MCLQPDVDIPDDLNFDDLEELEDDEALLREVEEKHMVIILSLRLIFVLMSN